jgi:hypothetical protein
MHEGVTRAMQAKQNVPVVSGRRAGSRSQRLWSKLRIQRNPCRVEREVSEIRSDEVPSPQYFVPDPFPLDYPIRRTVQGFTVA